MSKLRTLIVDDEPIARNVLREELATFPNIKVSGEAANGSEALAAIEAQRPELVFLDLQMPGMDGFEVIRNLDPSHAPHIVILTAYDQYALKAFESGAVDYLLKPVRRERLEQTLERVSRLEENASARKHQAEALRQVADALQPKGPARLAGKLGSEYHLLDVNQVLACQADHELVWLVGRERKYLATQTLKQLEDRLAGRNFVRVHRNALVNLDHVTKMAPLSSQRWLLTLSSGQEFVVSKRQAKVLEDLLR